MANWQIMELVYEYKLTRAIAARTAERFGMRSQEMYEALKVSLAASIRIQQAGLEREAGLTYGNVWD